MKETRKVGWYISTHVVETVSRIAVESEMSISEIADRLLHSGLSSNTVFTPIERYHWYQISLKHTVESILKCESRQPTGTFNRDLVCLMGIISAFRRSDSTKYGLYLITLDEILEKTKIKAPNTYIDIHNIVKKYKKVYKDLRTVEPQNPTVDNVHTNNVISIELNDEEYIKAKKLRR